MSIIVRAPTGWNITESKIELIRRCVKFERLTSDLVRDLSPWSSYLPELLGLAKETQNKLFYVKEIHFKITVWNSLNN